MPAQRPPPPPGGDQNHGNRIIILQSILLPLATALIVLRLYVRTRIIRALGLDDLSIVVALLLGWFLFALGILAVKSGQGRHAYYLTKAQLLNFSKYVHIALPTITLQTAFSRLSIALFLLRIVNPGRRWKQGLWVLIAFITVNYVAMFISAFLQCVPVEKLWNSSIPGSCWSQTAQTATNIWQGIFSILCDFVLALLPILFLWDVRITLRRKVGICILMGLGVVTGICAIFRTVLTVRPVNAESDPTWDTVATAIWAALEELFLLIIPSIPAIQPLFKRTLYQRGYVSDYNQSGAIRLKSKSSSSRDPYPIDYDEPTFTKAQITASKATNSTEIGSETELNPIHAAERMMV